MSEDRITMTKREVERYQTIQRCLSGEITQAQTGEWLGLSERQIRRLVKRVRHKGMRLGNVETLREDVHGREGLRRIVGREAHERYNTCGALSTGIA